MGRVQAALWGGLPVAILLTAPASGGDGGSRPAIWPMYRGDSQRTGRSPFRGPARMRVKWEVNLGAVIVAAPVVAPDGTLCVIAGNHLRAVGPDGALLWSLDLAERGHARRPGLSSEGFTPQSAVLAPDGTLYQTLGGFLACVLAVDTSPQAAERLKWVSKGTETRSSPLFVEGTLFTGVREGVRAFDTGSEGKATWRQAGPYYTSSSLARSPDGATLYVGGSDGNLHALDSATGQRKWSAGRSERAGVRLAEKDARGKTMRHFTTAGHIPEAPAVGPDGTIYFGSWDGYLRAASPDGRIRWSIDLKDRLTSAPALGADGRILISTFEGTLYAVRVVDGRPVVDWQAEANSRYSSPLISSDGKAYVGTMDGRLRAYALADGGKAGDLAPGSSDPSVLPGWITASPVPGGDGVLYIGGSDGFLRAVE